MNITRSNIDKNIVKFYNSKYFSDIILMGYDTPKEVYCHLSVLNAYNKAFYEALCYWEKAESVGNNKLRLELSYYWLTKFIRYIYTGKLSINYNEFSKVIRYAWNFYLYEIPRLLDNTNYIQDLIKVNGCRQLWCITHTHRMYKIEEYITTNYTDVYYKTDVNTTPVIAFYNSKCIFDFKTPMSSNDVCNVRYGSNGIKKYIKALSFNNPTLPSEAKSYPDMLKIYTIIREGTTTITVNNHNDDPLLSKLRILKYRANTDYYKIYSPNKETCIIAECDKDNGILYCIAHYNGDVADYTNIYNKDKFTKKELKNGIHISFSLSYIYLVTSTFHGTFRISYTEQDLYNRNISKKTYIGDSSIREYTHILDTCYVTDMIYLLLAKTNTNNYSYNNGIISISPTTNQIIYIIRISGICESLLPFGNNVYCGLIYNRADKQSQIVLYKITNGKLNKLNKLIIKHKDLFKFIISGSYCSNKSTHIIS